MSNGGKVLRSWQGFLLFSGTAAFGDDVKRGGEDDQLRTALKQAGFTGKIEATLEQRLRCPVDARLAELGRLLFFDTSGGLHNDNTCGGCHSPSNGFGDTQSIAIGVQNNLIVGQNRSGPRNQRRTPTAANTAFYPKLMWNGRFAALSGNPFNNSQPFSFPLPEGITKFPAFDPVVTHLLIAQAHIPPTELVEVAGFTGTRVPSVLTLISSTMAKAARCRRPTETASEMSRFDKLCWHD